IVKEVIEQTGATSMQDMGKVIGAVVAKVKGLADGKRISESVKKHLSS
ncbi:MAG: GatB/YqeY domain-containing protein, partial [Candidatus Jacksonbacteria bacterium]|nr:GatB/YqeY domain-containing protein [Candidatus Jacksonbacteria bacterium]